MNNVWDVLGHERIGDTVTAEWLTDTVCLLRFLYDYPTNEPYRGVVNAHITGDNCYEYKGMVFRDGEAPTLPEHRNIKGYFKNRGLEGVAKRLKNGNVITKHYH